MAVAEAPVMHPDFPRWHAAISLGNDQSRCEARWNGVSAVAQDGSSKNIETLVRLAFRSRQAAPSAQVQKIRETFKTSDPTFDMAGNDRELQVLAGATLAAMMREGDAAGAEAALAVSTTAFGGTRSLDLPLDLRLLAIAAIDQIAEVSRKRPTLVNQVPLEPPKNFDFDKAAAKAREQTWESVATAFSLAADATRSALATMARRQVKVISAIDSFVRVQDEELQMLWWLIGQRSEDLDCGFDAVPGDAQPLVFGKELADHTVLLPGPVSIKGLLSRAGLRDRKKISISNAINASDATWLQKFAPEHEPSPVSQPIHYGIKRQLETGAGDAWVAGWAAACGVSATIAMTPLELGLHFYRERLLLLFGDE